MIDKNKYPIGYIKCPKGYDKKQRNTQSVILNTH